MFNKQIFKQSLKSNYILFLAITLVSCIFLIEFSAMKDLAELLGVIYYQMIAFLLPTIYLLIATNKLMCQQVDSGAMAYTLSSPVRRTSVVASQLLYLFSSVIVMFTATTLVNICTNQIVSTYKISEIVFMNLSSCVTCLSLGGLFYLVSTFFNLSKKTLGLNGILTGVFFLSSILSMFSGALPNMGSGMDALKIFKYTSLFSLIDSSSILAGTSVWIPKMISSLVIAIITVIASGVIFKKKDLPL